MRVDPELPAQWPNRRVPSPHLKVATPKGFGDFGDETDSEPGANAADSIGGVAVVNANPPVALARASTGFVAYSLRCPHQGTTVNIVGTTSWRCPNHDALFASTGAWTGGQRSAALIARTVTPNAAGTFVVVNLT